MSIGIDGKSKGLISLISFKVINLGAEDVHGRLYICMFICKIGAKAFSSLSKHFTEMQNIQKDARCLPNDDNKTKKGKLEHFN